MSLLDKVAAIKGALDLPPDLAVPAALAVALRLMGVVGELVSLPLPEQAARLVEMIGCTVAPTACAVERYGVKKLPRFPKLG